MDVEIHAISAFSFLQGASLPEDLAHRAADLGYRAVALLDRDGVYGAPRFHRAARERGLRAIVGAALAVHADDCTGLVGLYARTREGYKNLCRLITLARMRTSKLDAREGRVVVHVDELVAHRNGLSLLLLADEAPLTELRPGDGPALRWARLLASRFGTEHTWVQHTRRHVRAHAARMQRVVQLAEHLGLRTVASNSVRYAKPEHSRLADILTATRLRTTLAAAGRRLDANGERYLESPGQLARLFRDSPGCVQNAYALVEQCEFTLEALGYRFPEASTPTGQTAMEHLRARVDHGARERYRVSDARVRAQLERELALIERLELPGYFLIVWDIVRYCREHGILVQGRGSAANSAVCYALGITAVDPVDMDLLFERFLSEERGEWPDIDLDLPSGDQRERVIQYVYQKYGERGAALTANVVTYRARSALRECGRALGLPRDVQDRIARQVDGWRMNGDDMALTLERAGLDPKDGAMRHLLECAIAMQNLPRHLGQHPGGMVIAAGRLDEICPLEPARMPGRVVIQWDKDDCSDLGILKVDLLGLGMMALLEHVVPMVAEHDGVELDLAHLPPDDPATYDMLCKADTVGVFQVESRAQMATLPRLKPRTFYDLVIEVAIIRPGPIVGKLVHPYLARRAGRQPVQYAHPSLEPILARTLGVPLFQEQLMRMAMVAAGFTGGEAEELRRAMGSKRSVERMTALERRLRQGMTERGLSRESQDQVVQGIASFALYGFPESHAASFALLAYASAYIKCHYTASFTCSLLNQWPMGFYHPSTIVKDAQRHGVTLRPVDVMRSNWDCTREGDVPAGSRGVVRVGLRYVEGLRERAGRAIERERGRDPFASIGDLARRAALRDDELTTLAELGALANVPRASGENGWTRRDALWQVMRIASRPKGRLFENVDVPEERAPVPGMTLGERIAADFRAGGLSVGPHPMALLRAALKQRGVMTVGEYLRCASGTRVSVAGTVITRQKPPTAKGVFFLTIEDETGLANGIVSATVFERERSTLVGAPCVVLTGVAQRTDGAISLSVEHAEAWEQGTGVFVAELPEGRAFR